MLQKLPTFLRTREYTCTCMPVQVGVREADTSMESTLRSAVDGSVAGSRADGTPAWGAGRGSGGADGSGNDGHHDNDVGTRGGLRSPGSYHSPDTRGYESPVESGSDTVTSGVANPLVKST